MKTWAPSSARCRPWRGRWCWRYVEMGKSMAATGTETETETGTRDRFPAAQEARMSRFSQAIKIY
jgi:hypothetical protein